MGSVNGVSPHELTSRSSKYDYSVNNLGQRTGLTTSGSAFMSRPRSRVDEGCASGERVSIRAVLARAAAFGVAGSSGTFSTRDRYST